MGGLDGGSLCALLSAIVDIIYLSIIILNGSTAKDTRSGK